MKRLGPKLFSWASILEENTKEQAWLSSTMPFIWPHIALMPDAHLGKGATVGSVIPTLGAIMPAAVGVDIGCGMMAVLTQFTSEDVKRLGNLQFLREVIERVIPLSAGKYNERTYSLRTDRRIGELASMDGAEAAEVIAPNWDMQLGSLGSGNHFIEVSLDEQQRLWLFLHSGSRGVGNKLACMHIKNAQVQCDRRWIQLPNPDLAYLIEGEPEFDEYIKDLCWAQHFALLNRAEMMMRVEDCVAEWAGDSVQRLEEVNCHHNYTETLPGPLLGRYKYPKGRHGHVWLSRKGAIDASEGKLGLIPGSMGAASYVVVGKGNPLSLYSSPHGAGRAYSRGEARRTFSYEDLEQRMKEQGIEWRHTDAFLDEHPEAYKNIDVVMADANDLVEIKSTLRQIINVKGD